MEPLRSHPLRTAGSRSGHVAVALAAAGNIFADAWTLGRHEHRHRSSIQTRCATGGIGDEFDLAGGREARCLSDRLRQEHRDRGRSSTGNPDDLSGQSGRQVVMVQAPDWARIGRMRAGFRHHRNAYCTVRAISRRFQAAGGDRATRLPRRCSEAPHATLRCRNGCSGLCLPRRLASAFSDVLVSIG
jgi:hypothetical protein